MNRFAYYFKRNNCHSKHRCHNDHTYQEQWREQLKEAEEAEMEEVAQEKETEYKVGHQNNSIVTDKKTKFNVCAEQFLVLTPVLCVRFAKGTTTPRGENSDGRCRTLHPSWTIVRHWSWWHHHSRYLQSTLLHLFTSYNWFIYVDDVVDSTS